MILRRGKQQVSSKGRRFLCIGNKWYADKILIRTILTDYDVDKTVWIDDDVALIPILAKEKFSELCGCIPDYIEISVGDMDSDDNALFMIEYAVDSQVHSCEASMDDDELQYIAAIRENLLAEN